MYKSLPILSLSFLLFLLIIPGIAQRPGLNSSTMKTGPQINVTPSQLDYTVPQYFWETQPLTLTNTGDQTLTFQITDAIVSAEYSQLKSRQLPFNSKSLAEQLKTKINKIIQKVDKKAITSTASQPFQPSETRTQVITDSSGDATVPGMDIVSVDFDESFFAYDITINFAGTPDTNSLGIISFDMDQNFGSGSFPTPFGIGLGNFDLGAEYEILFDFANFIGDTLGIPPSAIVIRTSDSSLVGLPMPISFSGNSASANFIKGIFTIFEDDMNMGALMLHLGGASLPDWAPDYGHGILGSELGSSWVTELDSSQTANYPYSGSLAPGDSEVVFIKTAAAYPMGNYQSKLIIENNSPTTPVEVPVSMEITFPGQPAITVNPLAVSDTLSPNSGIQNFNLDITNSGTGVLIFTVVDTLINGENWLDIPMPFGSVLGNESTSVSMTIDPTNLTVNTLYQAQLTVYSNDLTMPEITIPMDIYIEPETGISQTQSLPTEPKLYANYPNPFNPATTIRFRLPASRQVTLTIYNMLGQKVRTLVNRRIEAGYHRFEWNGTNDLGDNVSSGVYFYRFKAGDYFENRKLVLTK